MTSLTRFKSDENGTFGILKDDNGSKIAYTCEEPWLDNSPDRSCIPTGAYQVEPYSSPKFSDVWQITGVPGRGAILIHNGNTINDTHGCVLVGDSLGVIGGLPAVLNSVKTLAYLKGILPGSFRLVISNANVLS
jgi:Family of unknown function (DUF5675)